MGKKQEKYPRFENVSIPYPQPRQVANQRDNNSRKRRWTNTISRATFAPESQPISSSSLRYFEA
jgi:hypothetical protein